MRKSAENKSAVVYMAVNVENGHSYIGVTTQPNLRRRISEHVCGARRGDEGGERKTYSSMNFCYLDEWCPNPE